MAQQGQIADLTVLSQVADAVSSSIIGRIRERADRSTVDGRGPGLTVPSSGRVAVRGSDGRDVILEIKR